MSYTEIGDEYENNRNKSQSGKGKRFIKIFLCIIVLATVSMVVKTVVRNVTEGIFYPKYEQGVIQGDTYTSEFLGFKFVCPDDCEMKEELLDQDAEEILGLDDNKSYQEGKEASITEISVSDGTGTNNFNILIQKGQMGSIENHIDELESAYEEMYSDIGASFEIENLTKDVLAGEEYEVIEITSTMYGVQLEQKQYIREIGKYTVFITFTGDEDKFIDYFSEI